MIRKLLSSSHAGGNRPGGKRNYEIQRIETFSDAVFAFAVTLLIVSLEVPHSFEELLTTMRGFFAFGISFVLLVSIWMEQHRFFRLYGMDDRTTLNLNILLLFIVLFYVYPLKFLFSLLFSEMIYGENKSPFTITAQEVPALMTIYDLGFIAIYMLFFLMYLRAGRKSSMLGMTALEKYDCESSMYRTVIMIATGVLSLTVAQLLQAARAGWSGYVYFLIGPAITLLYSIRNRNKKKLSL